MSGIKIINNTITGSKFASNLAIVDNQILCWYQALAVNAQLKIRYNFSGDAEMLFVDSINKTGFGLRDSKYVICAGGTDGLTICQFRWVITNAPVWFIAVNGWLQVSSDERLKTDIDSIDYDNDIYKNICDIKTRQFVYKADDSAELNYGCVVQQ